MNMQVENKVFPSLFVSHGAPSLAIEKNDTVEFLRSLGAKLGRPRAILCVSAHWGTHVPTVSAATQPETIHDFGGFPEELYRMRYPAPGAPDVAARTAGLLKEAGIQSQVSPNRGLDHGAWVPLMLMYPEADIPVTQLSMQPQAGTAAHFRMGQALAVIRREGVLVLATGSATHNLSRIGSDGVIPEWAAQFDEWLYRKITGCDAEGLMNYRQLAPHSQLAHPTDEHLLPLFVAMGAGSDGTGSEKTCGQSLHRGWTHGSLSMAAYRFGDDE
jgi:4,5-DOPA dioxygenase extradiol